MDLTSPFNFKVASVQFLMSKEGIFFCEKLEKGLKVFSNTGEDQEISNNLSSQNESCSLITLENGNSIIVSKEMKIMTLAGWKTPDELSSKDLVFQRLNLLKDSSNFGKKNINFKQSLKTNSMPIFIPEKNSIYFSEWLGLFISKGWFSLRTNKIYFKSENEKDNERFSFLTEKVFKLLPLSENTADGKKLYFYSANVLSFIKQYIGSNKKTLKIPYFLLEGSNEEILCFVRGVCSQPRLNKKNELEVLITQSKLIADLFSLILRNNGYFVSITKNNKNQDNSRNDSFQISLRGIHPLANKIWDYDLFKKNTILIDTSGFISNLKIKSYHPNYAAFYKLNKKNVKTCEWDLAEKLGVDLTKNFLYLEKVKSVKDISVKINKIKTLYPEGLCFNNFLLMGTF